eukprot:UN12770
MSDHNHHISIAENVKRAIAESLEQHHDDWNERTDFTDVKLIGYLCDDGEVIQGDLLLQKPGKIFVYFSTDIDPEHCGNKYDWISIPNARLCPPPKKKQHPVTEPFEPQHPVTYGEAVDKWVKEKTERRKKESIQREQCKILVAGFIKDQEKKQIARSFPGLQLIIAHYCCLLIYGLPIISNWKTYFKGNNWSKRTDFTGVESIGYLCDDGEVIQGDILQRRTDQIFVHFTTYSEDYGKNYGLGIHTK